MGNYKTYFALSAVFGLIVICSLVSVLISGSTGGLIVLSLIQIPLGLMQLVVGITLAFKAHNYPAWAKKEIRFYWILNAGYFIGLVLVSAVMRDFEELWLAWLFIVPWFIAVYQFGLVWRMGGLRKRQLEKRELLQLFNH